MTSPPLTGASDFNFISNDNVKITRGAHTIITRGVGVPQFASTKATEHFLGHFRFPEETCRIAWTANSAFSNAALGAFLQHTESNERLRRQTLRQSDCQGSRRIRWKVSQTAEFFFSGFGCEVDMGGRDVYQ